MVVANVNYVAGDTHCGAVVCVTQ